MITLRDKQNEQAQLESILESDLIGQLCRKGRTVFYIYDDGQVFEGATRVDAARKFMAAKRDF